MRVSILCIGNELLLDDGVGPATARYIESRYRLPDDVRVMDRATMGMAVISDLRACDFALVLDAVDVAGERPGKIFSFSPDDVAPTPAGALSLHDTRFADVLNSARLLGIEARGHCLGIQVENMSPSGFAIGLTPSVAAAVPLLAEAAMGYLKNALGVHVVDVLAETDPYRSGRGFAEERDFSPKGRRTSGAPIPREELDGAPIPVLPTIYGDPTAEVMGACLQAGLTGLVDGRIEGGLSTRERVVLSLRLPAAGGAGVAERFGLERFPEADGVASEGPLHGYLAYVGLETTGYDCEALCHACVRSKGCGPL